MHLQSLLTALAILAMPVLTTGAALTPVSPAPPGAKEGIVFDPETGNYMVTYSAESEYTPKGLYQTIYIPATKIDPVVTSHFVAADANGKIVYRFKIKNGNNSQQNIESLTFTASTSDTNLLSPPGWDGTVIKNFGGSGFRVGWSYTGKENLGGLVPGKILSGLSFKSDDLPGVGTIELVGATPIQAYAGYGASQEIADEVEQLDKKNFVPRPAAVPLIPVANPFDPAAVLSSMQKHVNQDLVTMKLVDPTFASKLDRLFQTAIAAAKDGNTVALKGNLGDLRKLLKNEYADVDKDDVDWDKDDAKDNEQTKSKLIDMLAAKVLDFYLKYIQKRLGDI